MDIMYIATGTSDFLQFIQKKYKKKNLIYMNGTDYAILLEETKGKTVFQMPKKYEVLEAKGNIPNKGFAVFHYIPVLEESRPVFEHKISKRPRTIEHTPGYIATRILRPVKDEHYLVITCWESGKLFKKWANMLDSSIEITKFISYPNTSSYLKYFTIGTENEEDEGS